MNAAGARVWISLLSAAYDMQTRQEFVMHYEKHKPSEECRKEHISQNSRIEHCLRRTVQGLILGTSETGSGFSVRAETRAVDFEWKVL